MPSTPLKAVGIRGNENTPEPAGSVKKTPGSQKKDLWSRSSASRFSGHGSIYNATAGLAPLSNTTPSKQQSSSLSQRYATPAERMAGSTPTRALSSTFASNTNRFSGKTSLYGAAAASVPGAGDYNPVPTTAHIKGVVKLQAVIRRRQSRGIFAAQEKLARQVPSPGKYEAATLTTAGGGGLSRTPRFTGQTSIYSARPTPDAGSYAPPIVMPAAGGGGSFAHGAQRFQGEGSIYPTAQTPGVGQYSAPVLDAPQSAAGGGSFAHGVQRFEGGGLHGSIYGTAKTPGVGEYDVCPPAAPPPAAAGSAAFQGTADRFGGPNSLYSASDAPGPGRFAPDDAAATPGSEAWTASRGLAGAQQSTFASGTDRFAGTTPGSLYGAAAASVPSAGEYNPEMNDKIKGLVKLQACVRRRLSRGIFAEREKVAAEVPAPGEHQAYQGGDAVLVGGSFGRGPERFLQGSIYAASEVDMASTVKWSEVQHAALKAPPPPAAAGQANGPRYSEGGTAVGVYEELDAQLNSTFLIEKREAELCEIGSLKEIEGAEEAAFLAEEAEAAAAKEAEVKAEAEAKAEEAEDAEAVEAVEAAAVSTNSTSSTLSSLSSLSSISSATGVTVGSSTADALALLRLGEAVEQGETVAVAEEEEAEEKVEEKVEEGEAIFAQLLLVARGASVSRDDYYSAEEGWDLMGLSSDLEIFSSQDQ